MVSISERSVLQHSLTLMSEERKTASGTSPLWGQAKKRRHHHHHQHAHHPHPLTLPCPSPSPYSLPSPSPSSRHHHHHQYGHRHQHHHQHHHHDDQPEFQPTSLGKSRDMDLRPTLLGRAPSYLGMRKRSMVVTSAHFISSSSDA